MSGFFKGTSIEQDSRYFNQQKKLMEKMSFPDTFNSKVNMKKVNIEVINVWIAEKITEILGFEDEIVTSMAINLLQDHNNNVEALDPRKLQIQLTGFLERDAAKFTEELWSLLLSAQENSTGIPSLFLEKKKEELKRKKEEEEKQTKLIKQRLDELRPQKVHDKPMPSRDRRSPRPRSPPLRRGERERSQSRNDRSTTRDRDASRKSSRRRRSRSTSPHGRRSPRLRSPTKRRPRSRSPSSSPRGREQRRRHARSPSIDRKAKPRQPRPRRRRDRSSSDSSTACKDDDDTPRKRTST